MDRSLRSSAQLSATQRNSAQLSATQRNSTLCCEEHEDQAAERQLQSREMACVCLIETWKLVQRETNENIQ